MTGIEDTAKSLRKQRDEQAAIVAREQEKLTRLDNALQGILGKPVEAKRFLGRQDYEGLGIVEATKRYLMEVGEKRSTEEIAKVLLERGVETRSKKFLPTVYATLNNASTHKKDKKTGKPVVENPVFKRVGDFWDLIKRSR